MTPCPSGKQAYPTAGAVRAAIWLRADARSLASHKRPGQPGGHGCRCDLYPPWPITRQYRRRPGDWNRHRHAAFSRDAFTRQHRGSRIEKPHCDRVVPGDGGSADTVDHLVAAAQRSTATRPTEPQRHGCNEHRYPG